MSESQKIAELRSLLTQLDQPKQVAEALPLIPLAAAGARAAAPAVARGATALAGKAKNAFQNFKAGMAGQRARTPTGTFTQAGGATKAGQAVTAAGQAVKNNAGKAAAAGAAASGAAGYMAGKAGGAATKPAAGAATKPAAAPAAAPAATTLTPQEEGEMGVLAQEFDSLMGQDTDVDKLILQYQKLRPGAASAAP